MKAVFIEQTGGLDALKYGDFAEPKPAAGEVLVKVAYSGVNFIDTYHRAGLYPLPLPGVIGSEGAGTVVTAGEGFHAGDHVAWAMARGSYAELQAVPSKFLVRVPEKVALNQAAAVMLQGMTAHYLSHSTFPLKKGQTALVHAAAGGTGRLLVQMAAMIGARVIGTAGTPEKAALAKSAGASDVILYREQDFLAEVKRIAGAVDVVYDSVGKDTFLKGLDCLKPRGMMVSFGQSSGAVDPISPLLLSGKGSLYLTRPSLGQYISAEELAWRSGDLFRWIGEGKLELRIDKEYPLAEAREAQADLEARKTTGKLILKT
jgi:NADPH:quinone reductase